MNIIINPLQEAKFYSNRILNQSSINNAGNTDKNSNTRSVNNGIYPAAENYAHILNQVSFKRGLSGKIKDKVNYCNYCGGNIYTIGELTDKAEKLLSLKGNNLVKGLNNIINEIIQSEKEPNSLLYIKKAKNSKSINFFENLKQLSADFPLSTCDELIITSYEHVKNKDKVKKLILKNLKPLLQTADHTVAHKLIPLNDEILLVEACDTCNGIKGMMPFQDFVQRFSSIADHMPHEKLDIAMKASSRENIHKLKEILEKDLSEQARKDELDKFLQLPDKIDNNQSRSSLKRKKDNNGVVNKQRIIEDLPVLIEKKQVFEQEIQEQEAILADLIKQQRLLLTDNDLNMLKLLSDTEEEIQSTTNRINSFQPTIDRKKTLENKLYHQKNPEQSKEDMIKKDLATIDNLENPEPLKNDLPKEGKKKTEKNIAKTKKELVTIDNLEKKVIPNLNRKLSRLKRKYEFLKTCIKTPDELRAEIKSLNKILNEEIIITEKLSKIKAIDDKNVQIRNQANSLTETLDKAANQIILQPNYDDKKILDTTTDVDTFVKSLNDKDIAIEGKEPIELAKTLENLETILDKRKQNLAKQIEAARRHVNYLKVLNGNILTLKNMLKANESARARLVVTESERLVLQARLEELKANPPEREKITADIKSLTEKLNSIMSKQSELENIKNEIKETRKVITSLTESFNIVESDIYSLNQTRKSRNV